MPDFPFRFLRWVATALLAALFLLFAVGFARGHLIAFLGMMACAAVFGCFIGDAMKQKIERQAAEDREKLWPRGTMAGRDEKPPAV